MKRLLWWLFDRGNTEYALWLVNRDMRHKEHWYRLRVKWELHREAISFAIALIAAVIIIFIMLLVVKAVVPV
jgi:hypothetical protein